LNLLEKINQQIFIREIKVVSFIRILHWSVLNPFKFCPTCMAEFDSYPRVHRTQSGSNRTQHFPRVSTRVTSY
jgi:hypothetical protein